MSQNTALIVMGALLLVVLTAGLTYYIAKSSESVLPFQNGTQADKPTITVRGEATRMLEPDLLTISLSIESFGNDSSAAQAMSAIDTADVKAGLLAAGVKVGEIETGSYYTYPVYNESYDGCYYYDYGYGPYPVDEKMMAPGVAVDSSIAYPDMMPVPPCRVGEREIIGYKTVHELRIETSDTTSGGDIIDAALAASDAAKVSYVYFSITEKTRLEADSALQAQAAQAARVKAQNIASGLGASLGKIVSINPDYYYPYPMYAYDRAGMGVSESAPPAAPTELFPTDTELWSYITVVYELEQ